MHGITPSWAYHLMLIKTQIKKAYRKLVLQYHPDRNGGKSDAEKFRAIQEAYDALMEQ